MSMVGRRTGPGPGREVEVVAEETGGAVEVVVEDDVEVVVEYGVEVVVLVSLEVEVELSRTGGHHLEGGAQRDQEGGQGSG